MANWKKMAEAFGRAVHNRERLTDHAPLSNKGRMGAARNDAIEDAWWQRMADKAGAGEEFRRGFNDEEMLPDRDTDVIRDYAMTEFVPMKEFNSAQRNQAELDDVITAALDKRYGNNERAKAEARRTVIDKLKNGVEVTDILDYLDPARMFEKVTAKATPELRAQAIEMLQRGESIPDVLDILSRGY